MDDLYVYLRARANDAWARARPAKHEDKPQAATQAENSCMGRTDSRDARRRAASSGGSTAGRSVIPMPASRAVDACAGDPGGGGRRLACAASRPRRLRAAISALELVDPKVLRVCSDPSNMPFSNEQGEGFENKLAELFAAKLDKTARLHVVPAVDRLRAHDARLVPLRRHHGLPAGRRPGAEHQSVLSQRLCARVQARERISTGSIRSATRVCKGKRIGIVAGTPPATYLVAHGLMATAKPYSLVVDTRVRIRSAER